MAETPSILKSTQPLLYETGYDEWPYAYAGSCFPVRWRQNLYIVSAFHCYENHQVHPEDTLYPVPTNPTDFFGFSQKLRARLSTSQDLKHYDQIVLQVSNDLHSEQISSVNALDLSDPNSTFILTNADISDVWIRGYLLDNPAHAVDYQSCKLKQQAYVTNGIVSSRKSYDHCHCSYVKIKTPTPNGMSLNGLSGSAAYALDRLGNIKFAGTVIEFNMLTAEFLVIDPTILRELLKQVNDE